MPEKVEGIILDSIRFKENSVIAKIFTNEYGLITTLINGLGVKNPKLSLAYLQPLTYIECQLFFKDNRGVNKVNDLVVLKSPFGTINNNVKNSISVFIAEIVLRTHESALKDNRVFTLLIEVINVLSNENIKLGSLHVYFVIKYIEALGFGINSSEKIVYSNVGINLDSKLSQILNLTQFVHIDMTKNEKMILLNYLFSSLRANIGMFDIKSLKILEEVMS
jgi:DNA repair protein RecO (recombination protein O)